MVLHSRVSNTLPRPASEMDALLFAQDWCQARDLRAEGGTDMLGRVGHKVLDAGHDFVQKNIAVH